MLVDLVRSDNSNTRLDESVDSQVDHVKDEASYERAGERSAYILKRHDF